MKPVEITIIGYRTFTMPLTKRKFVSGIKAGETNNLPYGALFAFTEFYLAANRTKRTPMLSEAYLLSNHRLVCSISILCCFVSTLSTPCHLWATLYGVMRKVGLTEI